MPWVSTAELPSGATAFSRTAICAQRPVAREPQPQPPAPQQLDAALSGGVVKQSELTLLAALVGRPVAGVAERTPEPALNARALPASRSLSCPRLAAQHAVAAQRQL